jgi:hypothetical protein
MGKKLQNDEEHRKEGDKSVDDSNDDTQDWDA